MKRGSQSHVGLQVTVSGRLGYKIHQGIKLGSGAELLNRVSFATALSFQQLLDRKKLSSGYKSGTYDYKNTFSNSMSQHNNVLSTQSIVPACISRKSLEWYRHFEHNLNSSCEQSRKIPTITRKELILEQFFLAIPTKFSLQIVTRLGRLLGTNQS